MADISVESRDGDTTPCPNCGEPASGRFCSNCGVPLAGVACGACQAPLAPGARFCHVCGTPVSSPVATAHTTGNPPPVSAPRARSAAAPPPPPSRSTNLPLAIVAIAFLAVVAIVAAQSFVSAGTSPDATAQGGTMGNQLSTSSGRAPDISQMSPEERASRLYDRIMSAFSAGHMDTVRLFAPMATGAYEMLDSLTLDDRYDLGRIGEITGDLPLAAAQADTILRADPNHLLGLILAAQAAHSRNDLSAERRYLDRLIKAAPKEQARNLPGYRRHQADISAAIAAASKR
jgi:hypothetical protein